LTARISSGCVFALTLALALPARTAPPDAGSSPDGLPEGEELVVRFLDVGQGDGILLTLPDGKHVMVDGGKPEHHADDQLRALGVSRIDLLLASHADYDHAGVHEDFLREFTVGTYITNGLAHPPDFHRRTTEQAAELVAAGELQMFTAADFERGQDIGSGDVGLHLMPPPPGAGMGQNENSVGLVVTYGEFKLVMTGDSEPRETEAWLFTRDYHDLLADADIYKAAHHGSRNGDAGNYNWVSRISPNVVVICVGSNPWGHPTAEAMGVYRDVGARIYRTDDDGRVSVLARRDGSFTVVAEGRALAVAGRLQPAPTSALAGDAMLHFRSGGGTALGVAPADNFGCPETHPIKGNRGTRGWIYHPPDGQWYGRTKPEECFATAEDAEVSGYRAPRNRVIVPRGDTPGAAPEPQSQQNGHH
jgi:beta-lactamase superfamily II metal-dependent hydrolase